MKRLTKGSDSGYRIVDADWGYYVTIMDEDANECRCYEYDGACGTKEEVEKELKEHSYKEMVKRYADQCVYCECVEQIY